MVAATNRIFVERCKWRQIFYRVPINMLAAHMTCVRGVVLGLNLPSCIHRLDEVFVFVFVFVLRVLYGRRPDARIELKWIRFIHPFVSFGLTTRRDETRHKPNPIVNEIQNGNEHVAAFIWTNKHAYCVFLTFDSLIDEVHEIHSFLVHPSVDHHHHHHHHHHHYHHLLFIHSWIDRIHSAWADSATHSFRLL